MKSSTQWLIALACFSFGAFLSCNHPIAPQFAWCVLFLGLAACAFHSSAWLFLLPASLPFLSLSPWSGWHIVDEFDILILGCLAGGYGRLALNHRPMNRSAVVPAFRMDSNARSMLQVLRGLVLAALVLSLFRGFENANGFHWNWFGDYADSVNSIRIFKSGFFSFMFLPMLRLNMATNRLKVQNWFTYGNVTGLAGVGFVVLWERMAFPGLTEFSLSYRTVALFWEMHMGGGAIDAYLVLTAPFAVWAVTKALRPLAWAGAAVLLLVCMYAWLTTFSRGVYLATVIGLLFLYCVRGVPSNSQRVVWRRRANAMLICCVLVEVAAVFVGGVFIRERLSESERDWGGRVAHWKNGIALLDGPADWLFGLGLGRFPAQYSSRSPETEFSGSVKWQGPTAAQPKPRVRLSGPVTRAELGGLFSLEQRLGSPIVGKTNVTLHLRATAPLELQLSICEKHLLYAAECQRASLQVDEGADKWQTLEVPLIGPGLNGGPWYAPRFSQFALAVVTPGAAVEIGNVQISGLCEGCALRNADFSSDLAYWSYSGRSYFLPWHTDNLYLELLIEQGTAGLLLFLTMASTALAGLMSVASRKQALSPYLAASLVGLMALAMVVSVMDMPRVAFLLWTMIHVAHESHLMDVTISRNG